LPLPLREGIDILERELVDAPLLRGDVDGGHRAFSGRAGDAASVRGPRACGARWSDCRDRRPGFDAKIIVLLRSALAHSGNPLGARAKKEVTRAFFTSPQLSGRVVVSPRAGSGTGVDLESPGHPSSPPCDAGGRTRQRGPVTRDGRAERKSASIGRAGGATRERRNGAGAAGPGAEHHHRHARFNAEREVADDRKRDEREGREVKRRAHVAVVAWVWT